jgi:hypothetical protein
MHRAQSGHAWLEHRIVCECGKRCDSLGDDPYGDANMTITNTRLLAYDA